VGLNHRRPRVPSGSPALLLILPAARSTSPPASDTSILGLPLRRRLELAGRRAGLEPLPEERIASQTGLATTRDLDTAAAPAVARRRLILCPINVLPQPRWLRALASCPIEPEKLHVDPSMVAVVETEDPGKVIAEAASGAAADELLGALADRFPHAEVALDPRGRFALRAPADRAGAERWLLESLVKDSEGFMSRHFERRISLAITRRLVETRITPNTMTLVSVAVGLASAPWFLSAAPLWQVVGALTFLAHSVLDGCDGELARLKFLESRRGAMLDFWGDNVVHVAVFGCMAIGWSVSAHSALPLLLGLAAIGAVAVATAVLAGTGMQARAPGTETAGSRIVDTLANRDFIYFVLALSTIGRAWWFVAFVAIGTPVFVVIAVLTSRDRRAG
jgi:phosphatidylglycerophosphate synthase